MGCKRNNVGWMVNRFVSMAFVVRGHNGGGRAFRLRRDVYDYFSTVFSGRYITIILFMAAGTGKLTNTALPGEFQSHRLSGPPESGRQGRWRLLGYRPRKPHIRRLLHGGTVRP